MAFLWGYRHQIAKIRQGRTKAIQNELEEVTQGLYCTPYDEEK